MAKTAAELNTTPVKLDLSKDGLIVRRVDSSYSATLDVTGITEDVIPAGRMLVRVEATGVVKPQTITSGAYVEPTTGTVYAGVLGGSILKTKPFAAVVEAGEVNTQACDVAPSSAGIAALNHILFTQDR